MPPDAAKRRPGQETAPQIATYFDHLGKGHDTPYPTDLPSPDRPSTVNPRLTADRCPGCGAPRPRKRPRRDVGTPEYIAMIKRCIDKLADRIGIGDVEELPRMLDLERVLAEATQRAVDGLRREGYSWDEIARRTGTTRQAAHKRWRRDA